MRILGDRTSDDLMGRRLGVIEDSIAAASVIVAALTVRRTFD
jgi:hypothetical protein